MKRSLLFFLGPWLFCQRPTSREVKGAGASTAASDWWRGHFCHFAGAGHHLSPDCAVPLSCSTPGPHSDLLSKSQPEPYPPGPPMWKSALSLWGSAFWISVNTKRAAGTGWNVPYTKQPQPLEIKQKRFCQGINSVIGICFIWRAN